MFRRQRASLWICSPLRCRNSDVFSSATKTLPRWNPLMKRLSSRIGPFAAASLQIRSSPAAIRHRSKSLTKRANLTTLLQMPHRHCKTCTSPLHADDTHAECMSCLGKSHTDAAISGTDRSHCESFSLAFLRLRIAFFS